MRIGIDCRLWSETGVGRYIRNLVSGLSKLDSKNSYVLFILSKDAENIRGQKLNKNWKIITANIRWHTLEEQLKFPRILNLENLDLVHFPYFSVPFFYHGPFVVTIHDLIVNHFPTGKASTLPLPIYNLKLLSYEFVLSQAAKNAKKIIAVSNSTKNEIIDHLKIEPQKIEVIYEGVDEKIISPKLQTPSRSGIAKHELLNTKYFLYVGNAFPHKNLERLLKAFKTLKSDIKLVLVGKEDYFYKGIEKKVKEMNLSEKTIFLHNINDKELSELYRNALALVMPSLMEGFGLPVVEAMANNCPVLASGTSSLREVCSDAAIYFDPYNIQDIVKKLTDVSLNNTNYNENRKKGLERSKLFLWQKTAKETLKIYESCSGL